MKNFILIVSSILLIACTSQKKTISSVNNQAKEKKEGRKIYGTISKKYLKKPATTGQSVSKPKLSFKVDDEYFFIKIASTEISEQDLINMVGEQIEVRGKLVGEGFGGELPTNMSSDKKQSTGEKKQSAIGHILIYEILEEEK